MKDQISSDQSTSSSCSPRTGSTGIDEVDLLTRREIEARLAGPLLEAFAQECGRDRVHELTQGVIERFAREQGQRLAETWGDNSLAALPRIVALWRQGNALDIEMLEEGPDRFSFNVTRCRYAEMYAALGLRELGTVLSCSRDFALISGFNPEIELTRTQTIMEGAPYCDYRFEWKKPEKF